MIENIAFGNQAQPRYNRPAAQAYAGNYRPLGFANPGENLAFGREASGLMNPFAGYMQNQNTGAQANQNSMMSMMQTMMQMFQQVMQQLLGNLNQNKNNGDMNGNNAVDNDGNINGNVDGNVNGDNNGDGAPADLQKLADASKTDTELAQLAKQHATDGTGDGGHCFRNVAQDLAKLGIKTWGSSAYMAADELAANNKVQEVKGLTADQLKKLPAGAIVVWAANGSNPYGHISVAMGDGKEASDIMRNQITNLNGSSFRVFYPKA
jgi:hypothetical protein